jgi:hypothetical protein
MRNPLLLSQRSSFASRENTSNAAGEPASETEHDELVGDRADAQALSAPAALAPPPGQIECRSRRGRVRERDQVEPERAHMHVMRGHESLGS